MSALNLAQRRALDRAKQQLVPVAERLLDDAGVVRLKDFGQSQMRNLIAVALETEAPAVISNFLRYQMGRDGRAEKAWAFRPGEGSPRLGERFIEQLDGDAGVVSAVMAGLTDLFPDPTSKQLGRIELVRQFLGFADRYLRFLDLQRKAARPNGPRGGGPGAPHGGPASGRSDGRDRREDREEARS